MDNLEKSLNEELKRFNQIGYNSINLEEQMLGSVGGGSGFMTKQGDSERLKKFEARQIEMSEQEDVEAPAVDDTMMDDAEITSFDEMGVGDEEVAVDIEGEVDATAPPAPPTPPVPPAEPEVPAEAEPAAEVEVEVGDLIDKQETLEKSSEETNTKLDSLMSMLDGMEEKLEGMDQLMAQINNLEEKIETFRPQSEQEKLDSRKMDSGPYDQTLSDFWDDSQDKFEAQGKEEYILTTDDVDNFSDSEIQKSFNL